MSLTRTLTLVLTSTVLVIAGVAALWSYIESNHELEELFDAELAQSTRIVQGLVRHLAQTQSTDQLSEALADTLKLPPGAREEGDFDEILPDGSGHKYEKKIAFQIWAPDGTVYLSTQLQDTPLATSPGYDWLESRGYAWRTFALQDPVTGLWIRAAQRNDIREELSEELAASNILPLLVTLPLLALALVAAIRVGLTPLRRLEAPVRDMAPAAIHPLDSNAAPREVRGLVLAVNGLLQRLDEALERERRFSADAAHELRTPLAALRLNLERMHDGHDGDQRDLIASVDRMSHLVEQMLLLSKVDGGQRFDFGRQDLAVIVEQCIAELAPLALQKGITPELETLAHDTDLDCNAPLIQSLVQSLLANAIQYSSPDTVISAYLDSTADELRLRICDQGPGIPEQQRQRALSRFTRLDQRQGTGAGLGLAIARRITELHRGQLTLTGREDGKPGLCVDIHLPREH